MSALHQAAAQLVAAPPSYGTGGIRKWLQDNVVTVIGVLIGVVILIAAMKANTSKVIMVVSLGFLGLFWLGLAATGNTEHIGQWMVSLITG